MLVEIGACIVSYLAMELICGIYSYVRNKFKSNGYENLDWIRKPDEGYVPNDLDNQLIEKSKAIIGRHFPTGIEESLADMEIDQRMDTLKELCENISELYGIRVDAIKFEPGENIGTNICGLYDFQNKRIVINVDMLASDNPQILRDTVDTVIHECRHGLQYTAITTSDYPLATDLQKKSWANNYTNYIRPEVDPRFYYLQEMEFDARNFAQAVLSNF